MRSSRKASKSQKSHKNSFQFGTATPRAERVSSTPNNEEDDKDDSKSYSHSRHIRIELEQRGDQKKKRKDSYKVKITSFHEY